jgi:hypothetical protein
LILSQLCSQMEVPPQSMHALLCRLCSQMEVPPLPGPRSPCIGSSLGCARRWRRPHSPCMRSSLSCARNGHAGISSSAASSWPSSPSYASAPPPVPSPPCLPLPPLPGTLGTCPAACHADTYPLLVCLRPYHCSLLLRKCPAGPSSALPWSRGRSARRARRDTEPWRSVERTRHESGGRHRGALCPACPERAAADAGLQKTAEHAVVALYPHSSVQLRSSAPSLGAAEMGQALGLQSAEASLAATQVAAGRGWGSRDSTTATSECSWCLDWALEQ